MKLPLLKSSRKLKKKTEKISLILIFEIRIAKIKIILILIYYLPKLNMKEGLLVYFLQKLALIWMILLKSTKQQKLSLLVISIINVNYFLFRDIEFSKDTSKHNSNIIRISSNRGCKVPFIYSKPPISNKNWGLNNENLSKSTK